MTDDPDDLVRAAAWKVAIDADARGERPLGVDGWVALTDWLEADPRHAALLDAIEDAGAPALTVRRRRTAPIRKRLRRAGWLAGAAAAAAFVLAVVVSIPRSARVVFVTTDAPRAITLPDGSTVALNRRTRLEGAFGRRDRSLRLSAGGQAAFDVVHDPARPFTVSVDGAAVSVLGTRFDVDDAAGRLTVAVARGVVSVATASGPPVRVPAGQALTRTSTGGVSVRATGPEGVDAWTRGSLVYDRAPLSQVAADLSRYAPSPITVDEDAASLRFTGVLAIDKAPLMLARLVTFMPIEAYRTPTGVRLRAAHLRR